jgi:hypothetical protein
MNGLFNGIGMIIDGIIFSNGFNLLFLFIIINIAAIYKGDGNTRNSIEITNSTFVSCNRTGYVNIFLKDKIYLNKFREDE